jgi:hypothetical protein
VAEPNPPEPERLFAVQSQTLKSPGTLATDLVNLKAQVPKVMSPGTLTTKDRKLAQVPSSPPEPIPKTASSRRFYKSPGTLTSRTNVHLIQVRPGKSPGTNSP